MTKALADRFPPQIKYIIGNEGCERFSFYGMRSILTVYMVSALHFTDPDAEFWFHLFVFAVYFTPLAGAWLSDRVLGKHKTIFYLSFGYVAGHAVLALWESQWGLLVGLSLIAAGSGGIKPCVSAFVGDQFTAEQKHLVERVYGLFYWIINLGSLSSYIVIPLLLGDPAKGTGYGPRIAFAVPGLLMAIALVVYTMGRRYYVKVPPTGPNPHSFTKVVWHALTAKGEAETGGFLDGARAKHPEEAVEGAKAVIRITAVFTPVLAFWALFDQHSSSWTLQAEKLDLNVFGLQLVASNLGTFDPVFVLAAIPFLTLFVYRPLEKRGYKVTALRRMAVGMFMAPLSFVAAAVLQMIIDAGHHPSVMWQVIQYFFLGVSEVLVSATALEFAYTQAPRTMKSTIMSIWFLTIAVGNMVTAVVAKVNVFQGASYFFFFAALMGVAAIAFALIARGYKSREWMETSKPAEPSGAAPQAG
jgi:POT family proton-dependent oligopeptide transporter